MPVNHRELAHRSWAKTPDRAARTAPARAKAPGSIEYHLARLDPAIFANATEEQKLQAARSARSAYFARIVAMRADRRGAA